MAYVREVGAEPYITVGATPFGGYNEFTRITREQYLENAVEWVRYANIEKGYGIKYWANSNDLGHGIVVVDMIGQLLMHERVDAGMFWNTRWMDDGMPNSLWYALDPDNEIRPTGRGVARWGQFLLDKLVSVERLDRVVTWATVSEDHSELNLIIINKDSVDHSVSMNLNSADYTSGTHYVWSGSGQEDTNPTWDMKGTEEITGAYLNLALPAISVTVIKLES